MRLPSAQTTLTSDPAGGTAHVTASLDAAQVTADVEFVLPLLEAAREVHHGLFEFRDAVGVGHPSSPDRMLCLQSASRCDGCQL